MNVCGSADRWLGRRAAAALGALGLCTLTSPKPLFAADLFSIEIGLNGPNQSMPLGQSFVLTGSAGADLLAVHAVFVRTSFQPFGLGSAADCKAVQEQLGEPREFVSSPQSATKIKALSIPKYTPAMGTVIHPGEYWGGPGAEGQDMLMASSWFRKNAKEEQYSVRVPGDSAFFRQGARYCMLLYRVNQPSFQSSPLLEGFNELRQSLPACSSAQCVSSAVKRFNEIKLKAEKQADPEHLSTLNKLSEKLSDAAAQFSAAAEYPHSSLLARWPDLFIKAQGPKDDSFLHASEHPLARFLLMMLERGKEIRLWQNGAELGYATADGKLKIGFVRIVDAQTLEFRNEKKEAADAKRISVSWDSFIFPDSSLTVRDMLELSAGKIRIKNAFVRPEERFGSRSSTDELGELKSSLEKLHIAVDRSLKALSGEAASPGAPALTGSEIYKQLGAWLFKDVLADCKAWAGNVPFRTGEASPHPCASDKTQEPKAAHWPGFVFPDDSPLIRLSQRLDNRISAEKSLSDIKQGLDGLKGAYSIETEVSVGQGISFSRQSFFSQYITPTVGVGFITRPADPIPIAYLGAKVYLWPNSVDEPLWIVNSAAADVRRIPAFELGFGLSKQGLGDSGRYMGLLAGAFPPVFLGLSLQLLPYTTLSGGFVFMESRRSTLGQEVPHSFVSPYLSVGLDPNFIDFLVDQFSQSRNSATDVRVTIQTSSEGGP